MSLRHNISFQFGSQDNPHVKTRIKVIVYIRVSTEEQADSGLSIEHQTTKARLYCELHDLDVVDVIVDAGESAKSLKRPGLQRALSMLDDGADGLVITKLDRLTRSVADWQTLIDDQFGEIAGKALHSVQDSIDTTTAAGRLVLNVLLSVAQWEREAIGERTKAALQTKIARGERCGSLRYGYDLDGDGKTLVENGAEQLQIGRMRLWRSEGMSLGKIAARLNLEGIPTKKHGKWYHTAVNQILKRSNELVPTAA